MLNQFSEKEMKKYIVILLLCLVNIGISKQPKAKPLAAYLQDSTWHFIDENGDEFFTSKRISEVRGYSEGFFRVTIRDNKNKNHWEFLHEDGSFAFKPNSAVVYDMHNGMALSARKNMWSKSLQIFGYYDKNGNEVIKHKYDDAIDFHNGLAYVFNKNESGYINKQGKMLIPLKDKAGNGFSEGLAPVNTKEFKLGFINTKGEQIIDFKYDDALPFSEGKCAVHLEGYFAFIDSNDRMLVPPTYDFAHQFHENYAFVGRSENRRYNDQKWGLIDTTGKLIVTFKYPYVKDFSEGLAAVQTENKKWGFINYQDSLVIPDIFDKVYSFKNGLAWASIKDENKYGFINKNGEWIISLDEPKQVFDIRWNKRVQ